MKDDEKNNHNKVSKKYNDDTTEPLWRSLEKLAFYYINHNIFATEYDEDEAINLTRESKDNGYDAIWRIYAANGKEYIYLMESKLRTSQSSLTLNDCAKAIVIAFNFPADQLFISTNLRFSPQALDEIEKFQDRNKLNIQCITGGQLAQFYLQHKENIDKHFSNNIGAKFLKYIGNINQPIVRQETPVQKEEIDERHAIYIREIYSYLKTNPAILVRGEAGTGKSFVLKRVQQIMASDNYRAAEVHMDCITSPRALFVKILEAIWGVDVSKLLSEKSYAEIRTILEIRNEKISENILDAVSKAIIDSTENFSKYSDTYCQLFINYLAAILNNKVLKIFMIFYNLNSSQMETLSFLVSVTKILSSHNIKLVFELRDPIYPSDKNLELKSRELIRFCSSYRIEGFERNYAVTYINQGLQGKLSFHCCEILAELLEYNPLDISGAIARLNDKTEEYFNQFATLTDDQCRDILLKANLYKSAIIPTLIGLYRNEKKWSEIFELSAIFNGNIPFQILNLYFSKTEEIVLQMKNSTIFTENTTGLECHLKYQNAIEKSRSYWERCHVAQKLYEIIIRSTEDFDFKHEKVYLNILFYSGHGTEYSKALLEYMNNLMRQNVFDEPIIEALRCLDSNIKLNRDIEVEILLLLFECVGAQHKLNINLYDPYWNKLEAKMRVYDFSSVYKLRFVLLQWDKYFGKGDFTSSLEVIRPYYKNRKKILEDHENDYRGQVINAYGLTIKEMTSGESALRIFNKGCRQYPSSYYPSASKYSQLGNAALKRTPYMAERYYRSLLQAVSNRNYPWQNQLHAQIDIGMSMVMDYIISQSRNKHHTKQEVYDYILSCISTAQLTNNDSEKGRALILQAAMQVLNDEFENAVNTLYLAQEYLYANSANIYRWRAEFSIASILYHTKKEHKKDIIALLDSISQTLIGKFKGKICKDKHSVVRQVLLSCCMYYNEIGFPEKAEALRSSINNRGFQKSYATLKNNIEWEKKMNSKVFYVNSVLFAVG